MTSGGRRVRVAPSILAADFSDLREEIRSVEEAGADALHLDVMDGRFVPNLTFGPVLVRAIRRLTRLPLDVHLMIEDPGRTVREYAEAGSDWITFHVEAASDPAAVARAIRALGKRAGITLRPGTDLSAILPHLGEVDLVLVMSVEPGFAGQTFRAEVLPRLSELRGRHGFHGDLAIDGGVNPENAPAARAAGADILVAATAFFRAPDRARAVRALRGEAA